eukprot:TRINITY_DN32134_c0_g1_i1.p1 TRINITY_DN32134_c0_g1~~TRINITY_DN32134_c0_g1_i1.p1  ORF type:complete len:1706 (-),score=367.87 TRINITY_DN32134_c0_g1_i1:307-5424(-)
MSASLSEVLAHLARKPSAVEEALSSHAPEPTDGLAAASSGLRGASTILDSTSGTQGRPSLRRSRPLAASADRTAGAVTPTLLDAQRLASSTAAQTGAASSSALPQTLPSTRPTPATAMRAPSISYSPLRAESTTCIGDAMSLKRRRACDSGDFVAESNPPAGDATSAAAPPPVREDSVSPEGLADSPPDLDAGLGFDAEVPERYREILGQPLETRDKPQQEGLDGSCSVLKRKKTLRERIKPRRKGKATGPAEDSPAGKLSGDKLLERLMARRAARNGLVSQRPKAKVVPKDMLRSAVTILVAQLEELARVRKAAERAGWEPGCRDEVLDLEPPPAPLASAQKRPGETKGKRGSKRSAAAGAADELEDVLILLEPTELPADPICAANATDVWETEHKALIREATQAHRNAMLTAKAPSADAVTIASEEEAMALKVLTRLTVRAKDEPGRRTLIRRRGAIPQAAVFEKGSRLRPSVLEGDLPALLTTANEFEACTFLPCKQFAKRLADAAPGCLGDWKPLDRAWAAATATSSEGRRPHGARPRPKDFKACVRMLRSFSTDMSGVYLGRLARSGMTREKPFLIPAGLQHAVCRRCSRWVPRKVAQKHLDRCKPTVGAAEGSSAGAGQPVARLRLFRQGCGLDLRANLHYRHLPTKNVVEVSLMAPLDDVLRKAAWACYWEPDDVRASWRLARRGKEETGGLQNKVPSPDADEVPEALAGIKAEPAAPSGGGSEAAATTDVRIGLNTYGADDGEDASPQFSLRNSFGIKPAHQPQAFLRPLSPAQLHSLGWMRQREGAGEDGTAYKSMQLLRQPVSETDVCVEVKLERDFGGVRGGILADQLGYGKTACMIGLISESKSESIMQSLRLEDWVKTAGRRIISNATLIITPPNLFDQWLREFRKFVAPGLGLQILAIPSHSKMRTLSVGDFLTADVILVSFRFFFSGAYQRYFDELTKPGLKVWDETALHEHKEHTRQLRRAAAEKRKIDGQAASQRLADGTPGDAAEGQQVAAGTKRRRGVAKAKQRGRADTSVKSEVKQEPAEEEVAEETPDRLTPSEDEAVGASGKRRPQGPPLRLSKYYQEIRARSDYMPQRFLDLERHTLRLLQEGNAEQMARSRPLFEMFYFKRVVFDEFHDVVRAASKLAATNTQASDLPFYALHAVHGRAHWGLTATPLLSSASAVAEMAQLLRVVLPHDDVGEAQRFLDQWVTSNTWDGSKIRLIEHWVEVELAAAERALYLNQIRLQTEASNLQPSTPSSLVRRQGLGGGATGAAAVKKAAERRAVQLCTHFNPEGEFRGKTSEDVLVELLARQRELVEAAAQRLAKAEGKKNLLFDRVGAREWLQVTLPASTREANLACAHGDVCELKQLASEAKEAKEAGQYKLLGEAEAKLREIAQQVLEGTLPDDRAKHKGDSACEACQELEAWEERKAQLNRSCALLSSEHRHAYGQLSFLEAVASVTGGKVKLETPALCMSCQGPLSTSSCSILPCGHCFHDDCAETAFFKDGCCSRCRKQVSLHSITRIRGRKASPALGPFAVTYERYGSKLAKVVETVFSIQAKEGDATKCVVFVQWDAVIGQLEKALIENGLVPLVLRGNLVQRTKVISMFVDEVTPRASILLLSLEKSPVGMNLTCSHHLLLVHPMHADRLDEAVSYETQAIGRLRRQGQFKAVNVYRFVAKDTIEETLARQHQAEFLRHQQAKASLTAT